MVVAISRRVYLKNPENMNFNFVNAIYTQTDLRSSGFHINERPNQEGNFATTNSFECPNDLRLNSRPLPCLKGNDDCDDPLRKCVENISTPPFGHGSKRNQKHDGCKDNTKNNKIKLNNQS